MNNSSHTELCAHLILRQYLRWSRKIIRKRSGPLAGPDAFVRAQLGAVAQLGRGRQSAEPDSREDGPVLTSRGGLLWKSVQAMGPASCMSRKLYWAIRLDGR